MFEHLTGFQNLVDVGKAHFVEATAFLPRILWRSFAFPKCKASKTVVPESEA
jgi:hypothetical protein